MDGGMTLASDWSILPSHLSIFSGTRSSRSQWTWSPTRSSSPSLRESPSEIRVTSLVSLHEATPSLPLTEEAILTEDILNEVTVHQAPGGSLRLVLIIIPSLRSPGPRPLTMSVGLRPSEAEVILRCAALRPVSEAIAPHLQCQFPLPWVFRPLWPSHRPPAFPRPSR